ncbi:MAG: TetR family transcriptional regulator [Gemmatimonadales bacterium]|nr:TetR family transcriptional regulator [Gemmatimonadales bacterium]
MATLLHTDSARERDAERSRTDILDAAERLFALRGFEKSSLQEIGTAAGLSRGAPAYFFGSKQQLYDEVLRRCYGRARDAVRAGLARTQSRAAEPAAILAGAVADYFDFLTANADFVRLVEWEALAGQGALAGHPLHAEALGEALAALAAELGAPAPGSDVTAHLLLSILALCWFPIIHARTLLPRLGLDPDDPAFREARRQHVTALILRGAAVGEAPSLSSRSA